MGHQVSEMTRLPHEALLPHLSPSLAKANLSHRQSTNGLAPSPSDGALPKMVESRQSLSHSEANLLHRHSSNRLAPSPSDGVLPKLGESRQFSQPYKSVVSHP